MPWQTSDPAHAPRSDAEYLAGLPPAIQHELALIVRTAAGLSGEEKGFSFGVCAFVAAHYATKGTDAQQPGAEMVAALGMVVRLMHDEAKKVTAR